MTESTTATLETPSIAPPGDLAPASSGHPPRAFWDRWGLVTVLLAGSAIRLWMVLTPGLGYKPDQNLFAAWARAMREFGMSGFYSHVDFCNYPPFTMLVLWLVGHLFSSGDALVTHDQAVRAIIKAPACLADLAIAWMLFREGRRALGRGKGVAACALYYLNPVAIYDSAYWGQVDAVHTAFLMASLVLINRQRWSWVGVAVGLALAQKFQSVALVPLVIFEIYRWGRWRGLAMSLWGASAATAMVWAPFAYSQVLGEMLHRGYVSVVGQYPDLSSNAFNLWYLVGSPGIPDTSVPPGLAQIVAGGRVEFLDRASWLMLFTWRRIGLVVSALGVAWVLTVYSRKRGAVALFGAAGLLSLVFFLFPTEMHERYGLPAVAFLALWSMANPWQERAYFLFSALLALNLTTVLAVGDIASGIAAMQVMLFFGVLICFAGMGGLSEKPLACGLNEGAVAAGPIEPPASRVIVGFRYATYGGSVLSAGLALYIGVLWLASPPLKEESDYQYFSDLKPTTVSQGWGELREDVSVSGGLLHIGDKVYLRGLGTHAKSRIAFDIPEGFNHFEAYVGINRSTGGRGTATVAVELDGQVFPIPVTLSGRGEPAYVWLPLGNARKLTLRTDPTEDGNKNDHVDWGLARLVRASKKPDGG